MVKKKSEAKDIEEKEFDIKKVKKELNSFLEDAKEELLTSISSKVDEQIEFKVNKRMREDEKRFVRGKNGKIIRRDIVILLLIAIIGYFSYCLYEVDYFHIRTKVMESTNKPEKNNQENKKDENVSKPVEYDSTYYINKYRYLVEEMQIDDKELFHMYQNNITKEDLTNEMLFKIAYKNLDKEKIVEKDNMIRFKEIDLIDSLNKVLGDTVSLERQVFTYNNLRFMFYDDTYLGLLEEPENIGLLYEIVDAKMEDNQLVFEVLVAHTENNTLYDLKGEVVDNNYQNGNILTYKEKLSMYQFTFVKEGENYYFSSIIEK